MLKENDMRCSSGCARAQKIGALKDAAYARRSGIRKRLCAQTIHSAATSRAYGAPTARRVLRKRDSTILQRLTWRDARKLVSAAYPECLQILTIHR